MALTIFTITIMTGNFRAFAEGAAGLSSENLYGQAKKIYFRLIKTRDKQVSRDEWLSCIKKFVAVETAFPNSVEGYKAQYTISRIYHNLYKDFEKSEDLDSAIQYYQKVIESFPYKPLADDALYYKGEAYMEQKNYIAASDAFKTILEKHADGDQTVKARKALDEIEPLLNKQLAEQNSRHEKDSRIILRKVDYIPGSSISQVVVHTNGPVEIVLQRFSAPDRFNVDFKNARLDEGLSNQQISISDEFIERIRINQQSKDLSRLVLYVKPNKGLEVTATQVNGKVVVDIRKHAVSDVTQMMAATQKAEPVQKTDVAQKVETSQKVDAPQKVKASLVSAQGGAATHLVVLDPGHGGKDIGAQDGHGLLEKSVNLEVAKRVKGILEKRYKYRVMLTRDSDTFVALKDRGTMANENGASMFVSIHSNAAPRKTAQGIETYYLGIGSNERARETAARENGELVKSVNDDQVQQILTDLLSTSKINDSSRLAGRVQNHLANMVKKYDAVKNLGVKEGPFFVLHDTNMPSILIELGFITNVEEARRLDSPTYLNLLASSIARGIHEFLQEREPLI